MSEPEDMPCREPLGNLSSCAAVWVPCMMCQSHTGIEGPGSELVAQWGISLGERRAGETGAGSERPVAQAAGEASTLL